MDKTKDNIKDNIKDKEDLHCIEIKPHYNKYSSFTCSRFSGCGKPPHHHRKHHQ